MQWNKNSLKLRRPFRSGRKRKSFFIKLGARLDGWWRKLRGRPESSAARPKTHRPHPPAPVEIFDDLKIAVPKARRTGPPPDPSGAAGKPGAGQRLRQAAPLKKPAAAKAAPDETPAAPAGAIDNQAVSEAAPAVAAENAPIDETAPAAASRVASEAAPTVAAGNSVPDETVPATDGQAAASGSPQPPSPPCPRPLKKKKKPRSLTPAPLGPREAAEMFGHREKPLEPLERKTEKPTAIPTLALPGNARPRPRRSLPLIIAAGLLITVGVAGAVYYFNSRSTPTAKVARIPTASLPKVAPLAPGLYELLAREHEAAVKTEVTIAQGSNLGKALESLGIGAKNNSQALIDRLSAEDGLGGVVRPGAVVRAFWADRGKNELKRLEYQPAAGGAPLVAMPKAGGGFWLYDLASQPLTVNAAREGTVTTSLWEAGSKAGLDANIIMSLADILASDIDFMSDIKAGDTFQVLYNRDYRDGRPVGSPVIDMVKMTNRGTDYEFYRYVNSKGESGYFDPKGRSNLKTFFMSPLQYKRISSGFTMTRLHPIFKKVRPHQGVDYAAPSGTPVSAVASGTVIFADWNGGYGRLITIKHDDTYTTMYAHLSRFAPGIKKGTVVKQGDLIGHVGATGTATGPHLDFRLKKNGVFIDPLPELAKQQGKLLEAAEAQAFTQVVTRYRNRMTYQLANDHS